MSRILNVILTHQPKVEVEGLLAWWSSCAPAENLLLVYGGTEEEFRKLPDVARVFVGDPRLVLPDGAIICGRKDMPREKQSYGGVWRAAAQRLEQGRGESFTHVYFAEFDHVPVVPDLAAKLLDRAQQEQADILAHGLHRVDGTSNVHCLHHLSDPAFMKFWRRISVRSDKETVLKFVCTGSFWTRQAFMRVAAQEEEISAYLEMYLPTLAHHLGFRIRGFRDQDQCVSTEPVPGMSVERARQMGCWTVHPIKTSPLPARV